MTKQQLESLRILLGPVAAELPTEVTLEFRHFFSGVAAYANRRICITLTTVGLAMKVPEELRAELIRAGAAPLRYFPEGPVKKQYVVLPRSASEDDARLRYLARQSIDYVLTLPEPRRRRRTRAG